MRAGPRQRAARAILERRSVHIPDVQADPEYQLRTRAQMVRSGASSPSRCCARASRSASIVIYRHEVRPFTDSQIALLQTFADQAVIAIENARLFKSCRRAPASWRARSRSSGARRGRPGRQLDARPRDGAHDHRLPRRPARGHRRGMIFEYDEETEELRLRATDNLDEEVLAVAAARPDPEGRGRRRAAWR